jgi:hypothetical protein
MGQMDLCEALALREALDEGGWQWQVVLIAPGLSSNGVYYSEQVLREAASLFEGVRALARSDAAHSEGREKSVDRIVGWFERVEYLESVGLVGTFQITEDADWLRLKIRSAWDRGKKDLVQFSIVASGTGRRALQDGQLVTIVDKIEHAEFVDTVVDAAAGGRILALVAAAGGKDDTMLEQLLKLLEAKRPALYAQVNPQDVTEDQVLALLGEAVEPVALPPALAQLPAVISTASAVASSVDIPALEQQLQRRYALAESRLALREALSTCDLPTPARQRVQTQFEARLAEDQPFTPEHLTEAIASERSYLSSLHQTGVVTGFGATVASSLRVTEAEDDKTLKLLDDFFNRERHAYSFKDCYVAITGDGKVTGKLAEAKNLARWRGRFAESLTSTSFDQILADALNRAMVREYSRVPLDEWMMLCDIVPVNDFRTRHRVRMGGYANLPAVAQAAAYAALTSPSDEEATYAVTKRGGTEDLTLEMIKNDDVGAIRQIPIRMARAAKQTLHEFVFDFLNANPTIYDTVALFHATHANLSTTALSSAEYLTHRRKMRDQVEAGSSKPLGLRPKFLIIPNELEETAYNLFRQDTNLEPSFISTNRVKPQIIVVDYWTDANNWYTMADKMDVPTIEIGFLDDQREPEVFVQDMNEVGSMFTNDKRTYKIRHIYSGAVIDYRGFQGAVVP